MSIVMQSSDVTKSSMNQELDIAVNIVNQHKTIWVNTSIEERIRILDETILAMDAIAEDWVKASWDAKGLDNGQDAGAEEWALVAIIFRLLHALKSSLQEIKTQGRPQIPQKIYTRADGQVIAEVFPKTTRDKLLYATLKGEVWFNTGVTRQAVLSQMATHYQQAHDGIVTLVLAAGNASSLVPGDFLHKLFVENHVVVLKMNPVNDYLGTWVSKGFAPLIERGIFQIVYGGVDEGQYLIQHDMVDELHMTGSDATYEAIVFGIGSEGKQRKLARNPKIGKRFTAELGNISPVIIVPDEWTEQEVIIQAKNLCSRLISNAGFNCLTPRLIIQHKEWQHRDLFNQTVHETLAQIPTRKAYYPNAEKRYAAFIAAHPTATQHGDTDNAHLPWAYITDIDPLATDDIAFTTEAFCSIYTETALSAASIPEFIAKSVDFVNENVWGTLVASIIVHPDSMKTPEIAASVEQAIADLHYGTVAINAYGETAYLTAITPWGGYAGHDMNNIQSGTGFVNNTLMFDETQIQKSVIRQSFTAPTNTVDPLKNAFAKAMPAIAKFEAKPHLLGALKLIRALFSS